MIETILGSAARIINVIRNLGDDSLDFPSAGGVIAKSAFNQLFLSAIDRADRYGENSYAVFIDVANYLDMMEKDGPYYADFAVAKMSQLLSQIRRQSDIIGQTGKNEYALLLQRPQYESEPVDAANRFAEELSKLKSIRESVESDPMINVRLLQLPTGTKVVDHHITLRA
jgi:GGDEF domain-containing protein